VVIGGMFETWSPVRLTNYTIDAYGGPGTVEITGASSLVNSTLKMDGPNDNLLNEGLMTLQNSQLNLNNSSLSGSGMILATQGSTVTESYSTPVKDGYQQPLTKQQLSDLASAQPQLVSLKSSTLNVAGSPDGAGPVVMDANSTVNLEGLFDVGAKNFGIYATGPQLGTVNLNVDTEAHIAGIMQVDAKLNITGRGGIEIDSGRLILAGPTTGNTIEINGGMLEFAQTPGFLQSPETASEGLNSTVEFASKSGSIQFDGATSAGPNSSIGPLIIGIMPNMTEIAVFSEGHPIADLHIVAPPGQHYSASEFSVHGNTLLFHHS
jgi:hypothetical protein